MATVRVRRCSICKESGHNSRTCQSRPVVVGAVESQNNDQSQQPQQSQPLLTADGKEDLGLLSVGREKILVSLIPSQAESIVVKYQPDIQASCVIPPQVFDINYANTRSAHKKIIKVTTPTMIMSCSYGGIPRSIAGRNSRYGFTLWAIDTERKSKVYAKPYLLANVYTNGNVCFGSLYPRSLRQAYNMFWSSNFNSDLYRMPHHCGKKDHTLYYHTGCKCDPSKRKHTCSCLRVTFHRHFGCGCTTVASSKACKGSCLRNRDQQQAMAYQPDCDCCLAIVSVQDVALAQDSTLSQRKLNKLVQVVDANYLGCGCSYRHKRGCLCGKNYCDCECFCDCCKKKCNHGVCVCPCCRNTCSCRCNCNASQRFEHHVTTYNSDLMPTQKWADRTDLFCGTKFWAAPKGSDGVLITNNKTILRKIPRKFWRKDSNGHALLIALATRTKPDWEFESGNFKFRISNSNIVVN